jgi:hypothetical protein
VNNPRRRLRAVALAFGRKRARHNASSKKGNEV